MELVKMKSYWIRMGPKSHDWHPYKKRRRHEETHTEKKPCKHGGRDWSDAATGQGMPGISGSWRRQGRILPESFRRESSPATPSFQTSPEL